MYYTVKFTIHSFHTISAEPVNYNLGKRMAFDLNYNI